MFGAWIASEGGIGLSAKAPKGPGVYAFIDDGLVKYAGLTKIGFQRRMYSYSKPASTQRTRQRINETIGGHLASDTVVKVYIAVPPAHEWNDLPIHTAAGLEAGLIEMTQPVRNKMGVANG